MSAPSKTDPKRAIGPAAPALKKARTRRPKTALEDVTVHKVVQAKIGKKQREPLDAFFDSVRAQGWLGFFRNMSDQDILVTTRDIHDKLIDLVEKLSFETLLIEDLPKDISGYKGRFLLFLFDQETAVRRWILNAQPKARIASVFSDLLPNSLYRPARVRWQNAPVAVAQDAGSEPTPVIVMGAMGSEVSFLADLFSRSGAGEMRQFLPAAIPHAKDYSGYFPLARYIDAVETRFAEQGAYAAYLYTDTLKHCLQSRVFTIHRLKAYLKSRNVRIIYYTMRDKIRQALYSSAFEKRVFNSLWEMRDEAKKRLQIEEPSAVRILQMITTLIEQDIEDEALISSMPNVQIVTHEDLILAPKEVLDSIGKHTGRRVDVKADINWSEAIKKMMPNIEADSEKFARLIIDRLGLHANAAGSLVALQNLVAEVVEDRMAAAGKNNPRPVDEAPAIEDKD